MAVSYNDKETQIAAIMARKEVGGGIILPPDPTVATVSDIARRVSEAYFTEFPANLDELYDQDIAAAYRMNVTHLILSQIDVMNTLYKTDTGAKKDILSKEQKNFYGIILVYALLSTEAIRVIKYDSRNADQCRFAIREYNNRTGKYTGIWLPFEFGKGNHPSPICSLIEIMYPGTKTKEQNDTLTIFKNVLYGAVTNDKFNINVASDITKNYQFSLVPLNNGIYDGRDNSFTPWDDVTQIDEKYPDLCFLWKLGVDYNPQAVCPPYLDPAAFIESLFDTATTLGQASARILWQIAQFAIRCYAGQGGYMVYFCNTEDGGKGRNGKSTFCDLIKNLFTFGQEYMSDKINCKMFSESFEGFDSACLIDEVLHISSEQESSVKNLGAMKQYIRYDPVTCRRKNLSDVRVLSYCVKIQAMNGMPDFGRGKSKNSATFNRHIILKFDKNFNENDPNSQCDPKIKEYISKKDFLEYFVLQLLNMPFTDDYDHTDLAAIDENRQEMVTNNMPTLEALDDILPELEDLKVIPTPILYDFYKAWCRQDGRQNPVTQMAFTRDVSTYCDQHSDVWEMEKRTKNNKRRLTKEELENYNGPNIPEHRRDKLHPIITEYMDIRDNAKWVKTLTNPMTNQRVCSSQFDLDYLGCKYYTNFIKLV